MICGECRSFWSEAVRAGAISLAADDKQAHWASFECRLTSSAETIKQNASKPGPKCSICVCVWYSLSETEQFAVPATALCSLRIHLDQQKDWPSLKASFVDEDGKILLASRIVAMYDKETNNDVLSAILNRCGESQNESTGSDASFLLAHYWLNECITHHKECSKPAKYGFLPTRVLDVGVETDLEVVLRETSSMSLPDSQRRFTALSHCWGKALLLTTTLKTLDERMAGIPLTALTPVFRDAILTTRRLGLRFLWIDALCIIQDSKSDWEAESVQMCQIYQSAVLTIASAHSPDSQGGLFKARDGFRVVPFEICLDLENSGNIVRRTFRFTPAPKRQYIWDMRDLPLYTRAWCFQELVLAPRTLIFDFDLRWECLLKHGSERSPEGGISRHHNAVKAVQQALAPPNDTSTDSFSLLGSDTTMQTITWHHLIEDYTTRKLTKNSDRLIAIAGIADGLKAHSKNEYFAGLWKSQLPVTLLWYVRSYFDPPNADVLLRSQVVPRNKDPIAPSWSWASCELPAMFDPNPQIMPMCEIRSIATAGTPHKLSGKLAIFADTRTFYICSGSKSVMKEVETLQAAERYRFKGQYNLVQSLIRADALLLLAPASRKWKYRVEAVPGRWCPDEIIDENTLVTFIALARHPLRDRAGSIELRRPVVYTLALVPVGNTGDYRRVGYAEWEDCTWFGYDCAEDYEQKKECWHKLGKSWSKLKPPELQPSRDHKHPVVHDPLPDLPSTYHPAAAVKRTTINIV